MTTLHIEHPITDYSTWRNPTELQAERRQRLPYHVAQPWLASRDEQ